MFKTSIRSTVIGPWAAQSEQAGFTSQGVIDRLVYDNLDLVGGRPPGSAAHRGGAVALTSRERVRDELQRLTDVGCDDFVLLPCSAELDQVGLLADVVSDSFKTSQNPFGTNET